MPSERVRGRERSFAVLLVGLVMALIAVMPFASTVAAQDATPEAEGLGLDLQEVQITVSENTFSVTGSELLEGLTIITLINESEAPAVANLGLIPEEQSVGDLTSVISESFAGEGGELPEWWADSNFVGGAWADAGATTQVVLNFTAGEYVLFGSNPAATQPPQKITILSNAEAAELGIIEPVATPLPGPDGSPVAGDVATPVVEDLPSDAELSIADGAIEVVSDPITGQQLWKVTNDSSQVADLVVYATDEELDEAAATELATTVATGETPEGATLVGGLGTLSAGGTAYVSANLEAGSYVVFSTQPDTAGGIQASEGVVLPFTVE